MVSNMDDFLTPGIMISGSDSEPDNSNDFNGGKPHAKQGKG
jgi:hypothetical protein